MTVFLKLRASESQRLTLLCQLGGLVLIAGFDAVANALMQLGGLYGMRWSSHAYHLVKVGQITAAAILFFWLSLVVIGRTTLDRTTPRQRLLQRGAAAGSGALTLYTALPAAGLERMSIPLFGWTVAWLALEVCRSHGLDLNSHRCMSATPRGHAQTTKIVLLVVVACMVGGFSAMGLLKGLGLIGVPVMEGNQLSVLGINSPSDFASTVFFSAALEDVVTVAAVTALLSAARRPLWQIYVIVCVIEVLVHAYFGIPALGWALYAAGRVWLYLRYGRLAPLVIGHIAFDLFAGLHQYLSLGYRLLIAALLWSLIVLVDRWTQRPTAAKAADGPRDSGGSLMDSPAKSADRPAASARMLSRACAAADIDSQARLAPARPGTSTLSSKHHPGELAKAKAAALRLGNAFGQAGIACTAHAVAHPTPAVALSALDADGALRLLHLLPNSCCWHVCGDDLTDPTVLERLADTLESQIESIVHGRIQLAVQSARGDCPADDGGYAKSPVLPPLADRLSAAIEMALRASAEYHTPAAAL